MVGRSTRRSWIGLAALASTPAAARRAAQRSPADRRSVAASRRCPPAPPPPAPGRRRPRPPGRCRARRSPGRRAAPWSMSAASVGRGAIRPSGPAPMVRPPITSSAPSMTKPFLLELAHHLDRSSASSPLRAAASTRRQRRDPAQVGLQVGKVRPRHAAGEADRARSLALERLEHLAPDLGDADVDARRGLRQRRVGEAAQPEHEQGPARRRQARRAPAADRRRPRSGRAWPCAALCQSRAGMQMARLASARMKSMISITSGELGEARRRRRRPAPGTMPSLGRTGRGRRRAGC